MKMFKDAALAVAIAMALGTVGVVATGTAAYADDERKPPRSGMANAPGQACKEHKRGSPEYKACVAEHAKMNKEEKKAKADAAKKAEKAKRTKVDKAKRDAAMKKMEEARKGKREASQAPARAAGQ